MTPTSLFCVADYPSAPVMGGATLLTLGFIIGGGFWLKMKEEQARQAEAEKQKIETKNEN